VTRAAPVRPVPARRALLLLAAAAALAASPARAGEIGKNSPQASVIRGSIVFNTYCALCHGSSGEGDGRAARIYNPRPANLTVSPYNDDYKELMIRRGGEGMGRSPFMPPWGDQLSDEQISDLVSFLRSIKVPDAKVSDAKASETKAADATVSAARASAARLSDAAR